MVICVTSLPYQSGALACELCDACELASEGNTANANNIATRITIRSFNMVISLLGWTEWKNF